MSSNALDELADLVVTNWLLLYGPDRLRAGEVEVLGPGEVARLALNQALRRRIPDSLGLGGCWTHPGPPAALHPALAAPAPPDSTGASGARDDVDAFVRTVLRGPAAGREAAPGA